MKKILISISLFIIVKTTVFSQKDSIGIYLYSEYDSTPLMWSRIVILEKDKFSVDTFTDRDGFYVYYYDSINHNNTSFIFGLGRGVYAVHKRLIDLLNNPVIYHKNGEFVFDTISRELVDTNLCNNYTLFLDMIEKWNEDIRKSKKE